MLATVYNSFLRTDEDGVASRRFLIYGVGNGSTFSSGSLGVHHDIDTLRYAGCPTSSTRLD